MKNIDQSFTTEEYELELIESVNNDEWKSVPNVAQEIKRLQNIAISTLNNASAIQISIQKEDYEAIRKQSHEMGIPFHTLITSLIHNFALGQIKLTC